MKKVFQILLILSISITLCACGNGSAQSVEKTDGGKEAYIFETNSISIAIDSEAESILSQLGEAQSYFEAASCAFNGLDKVYSYSGFDLTTYTIDDVDYISEITIRDDSVTTKEGIYIGSDIASLKASYGEPTEEKDGCYIYEKGNTRLSFVVSDDEVLSISYNTMIFDEN